MPDGVEMASGYEPTARSIWPSIYPAILELVRAHRSTIVFVNNRRLAERLALRLNELARRRRRRVEPEIARAHHGSLAREQRVEIEEDLKAGRIPCLVATSSLELGIDMGAVDLVIQVESPKSVARGLQRVGRAGHELDAVSKGRIFPKFRADLLECAVVAKAMREGAIEETRIPRNPLDVLAQQVVAICADAEIAVDDLHDARPPRLPVRRALARAARERARHALRPLPVRRVRRAAAADRLGPHRRRRPRPHRARSGSPSRTRARSPTAASSGSSRSDGGGRVGELDEEMVYEAREGQTFMLGASTWRIEEITRDRVLVSPGARACPGAVPFWKGEGVGRPYELGARIGAASRELSALADASARERLRERSTTSTSGLPTNLLAFLREQERHGRAADRPHDRRRALPRRDRRLARLHPHAVRRAGARAVVDGARGPAPRRARARGAVALVGRRDRAAPPRRRGAARARRPAASTPTSSRTLVVQEVGQTALFGARFRENAGARAAHPAPAARASARRSGSSG